MEDKPKHSLGILAYGSLTQDPGAELSKVIIDRVECMTPFNVEYARVSKGRGDAPTVVPYHSGGAQVNAQVLVLDPSVTFDNARSMLWRRETNQVGKKKDFKEPDPADTSKVHINEFKDFAGVETVLYTSLFANLGTLVTADRLSYFAVRSALGPAGEEGRDGITYLRDNIKNGIITPLTEAYRNDVLARLGAADLDDALRKASELRPRNLAFLADLKAFEQKVRELTALVCDYGLESTFGDQLYALPPEEAAELFAAEYETFRRKQHVGFGKAQKEVVSLVVAIQDKKEVLERQLKEARVNHNKELRVQIGEELKYEKFKEDVLAHLMDTIAYWLYEGQTHIARRLYKDVEGKKQLRHANLPSLLAAADQINENPDDFALLSDLTSYIQTGDLVIRRPGALQLAEVKQGAHNKKLVKLAQQIQQQGGVGETTQADHQLTDHELDQVRRIIKQQFVLEKTTELLQNDKGLDTAMGRELIVYTPKRDMGTFTHRIYALEAQFATRNLFANDCIENCIHIGLSRGPLAAEGPHIIEEIAKQLGATNYIQFDARMAMHSLSKPLFVLPFERELLFDILFGRQYLTLLLDIDAFIRIAEGLGIPLRWSTEKQVNKLQTVRKKELFVYKKRGLVYTDKDDRNQEHWLYWGIFIKLILEHIIPSELLKAYLETPHLGQDIPPVAEQQEE